MPKLKTLKDINVKNKRALVCVNFDIPIGEKGEILDNFKIKESLPTIEYLIKQKAKIILISYIGRPGGKKIKKLSLKPVADELGRLLKKKIIFAKDIFGKDVERMIKKMFFGDILLLENIRFWKEEEQNFREFAEKLAKLGDIYINEAFANSHRENASIVGIPKFLPSAAGLLLEKEITELNKILKEPKRPLVAIIGGAKVETKIKVIEKFLKKADKVLIGGALPNTIFAAQGINMGKSFVEKDMFGIVKKLNLENSKLQLPNDFVCQNTEIAVRGINAVKDNESVLDIGPKSIGSFLELIQTAKMIVWNGPLGLVEKKPFDKSSEIIAKAIAQCKAYSVIGGGDTIAFIKKLGLEKKFNYVSTGGGAMLDYLANETLPGIKALER